MGFFGDVMLLLLMGLSHMHLLLLLLLQDLLLLKLILLLLFHPLVHLLVLFLFQFFGYFLAEDLYIGIDGTVLIRREDLSDLVLGAVHRRMSLVASSATTSLGAIIYSWKLLKIFLRSDLLYH